MWRAGGRGDVLGGLEASMRPRTRQADDDLQRMAAEIIMSNAQHWGGRDSLAYRAAHMELERLPDVSEV